MYLTLDDINKLDYLYKINLINSVSGFKSANLIATKSKENIANVAVFSSVVHYGSNPPILGFVLRPSTVIRNTYDNLKETGYYTINHIHEGILEDAHHTSAKYPSEISEFDKSNLEEEYLDAFQAPYVKGCAVRMGLKYLEEYHIKANDTLLVLGEIVHLYIDDHLIEEDGFVNLSKGKTAAINGLDGYFIPENHTRMTYQRPKKD
ncbi:flavin oxidoreductase [Polaribacter sp. SA4-10]|uniref:flavin reductase family protein n=1 Tax=Polaribacter sp. SA4-10 TaxID=754397 RepID=UPI000B3C5D82|nr:flavin reductase family protein [Polaribacter sp. SA4-10]ARV05771.1 flavin oxidoreductase [Polaribacter sp. SA4-10]